MGCRKQMWGSGSNFLIEIDNKRPLGLVGPFRSTFMISARLRKPIVVFVGDGFITGEERGRKRCTRKGGARR